MRTAASSRRRWERWLAVLALATIIAAWLIGSKRSQASLLPHFRQLLPAAERFEAGADGCFAAWRDQPQPELLGWVTVATGDGYGGPVRVAVAVLKSGEIAGATVIEHGETPSFMRRATASGLLGSLPGQPAAAFSAPALDGLTGATRTLDALVAAVRQGSHAIASAELGLAIPAPAPPAIRWGLPEVVLVLLFGLAWFGHRAPSGWRRGLRWCCLLGGLAVLGFVANRPLTLAMVNRLLLGYWPQWQSHLYWYLLLGGLMLFLIISNRNPYCESFCPFGAAQECVAAVGAARATIPARPLQALRWAQRGLAWLAIVLALLLRNPGISSYEVYGALFGAVGSPLQFSLLALVLIAGLFFRRPWCRLLCPLRPVTDLVRLGRGWARETWLSQR